MPEVSWYTRAIATKWSREIHASATAGVGNSSNTFESFSHD